MMSRSDFDELLEVIGLRLHRLVSRPFRLSYGARFHREYQYYRNFAMIYLGKLGQFPGLGSD
jgi:hypothetical protein